MSSECHCFSNFFKWSRRNELTWMYLMTGIFLLLKQYSAIFYWILLEDVGDDEWLIWFVTDVNKAYKSCTSTNPQKYPWENKKYSAGTRLKLVTNHKSEPWCHQRPQPVSGLALQSIQTAQSQSFTCFKKAPAFWYVHSNYSLEPFTISSCQPSSITSTWYNTVQCGGR